MKRSVPYALVGLEDETPQLNTLKARSETPRMHGRAGAAAGVPSAALNATACDAAFSSPPQWAATAGAQAAVGLGRRGRA